MNRINSKLKVSQVKKDLPKFMVIDGVEYLVEEISPIEKLENNRKYWMDKKLREKPQGFSLEPNGRAPLLIYRNGGRCVSFPIEISGVDYLDFIIFQSEYKFWINLDSMNYEDMTPEESTEIKDRLIEWMNSKNYKFSVGDIVVSRRVD